MSIHFSIAAENAEDFEYNMRRMAELFGRAFAEAPAAALKEAAAIYDRVVAEPVEPPKKRSPGRPKKEAETIEAAAVETPAAEPTTAVEVTLAVLQDKLREYLPRKVAALEGAGDASGAMRAELLALLSPHGVDKVRDLSTDQRAVVFGAIEAAEAELGAA